MLVPMTVSILNINADALYVLRAAGTRGRWRRRQMSPGGINVAKLALALTGWRRRGLFCRYVHMDGDRDGHTDGDGNVSIALNDDLLLTGSGPSAAAVRPG